MLNIQLEHIGKKFGNSWVFKDLNHRFESGTHTAILGSNGSGKSTLLNIISGMNLPTEGEVIYSEGKKILAPEGIYARITMAMPYMDLFEEFSLTEAIEWHRKFKEIIGNPSTAEVIAKLALGGHENKTVSSFSSGMKQRLKLGLALLSDVDLVLLDEPLTNLDEKGRMWYREMTNNLPKERLVIVCSNYVDDEFSFCTEKIELDLSHKS